jgi:predicted nucleic acid-binding protein
MRFAIDSNVIIYAEGLNDARRFDIARQLMLGLKGLPTIIPAQALGEALNVMIRKGKIERALAIDMLQPWRAEYTVQATTPEVLEEAFDIVKLHAFSVWDAVILAAASFASSETLFSEDMQNGFVWKTTTIINPFLPYPAAIARTLLKPN